MPTRRRRVVRQRQSSVSDGMRHYLETGDYPRPGALQIFIKSEALIEADWRAIRDEVLDSWQHEQPGCRPWAWWRFDAPEPRRRSGGTGEAYDALVSPAVFRLGVPAYWMSLDRADSPMFESQAAYLGRLGLLSPTERRTIQSHPVAESVVSILGMLRTGSPAASECLEGTPGGNHPPAPSVR